MSMDLVKPSFSIPEVLVEQARRCSRRPVSSATLAELHMFWAAFSHAEKNTRRALDPSLGRVEGSCEGGFMYYDLTQMAQDRWLLDWFAELGFPGARLTPAFLREHGGRLEGDGVLLDDGNLLNHTPYALPDARWAWAAVGYVCLLVDPSIAPPFPSQGCRLDFSGEGTLRLAIAGDWGTGPWVDGRDSAPSMGVGRAIAARRPDLTVHLGDVYPLGLPEIEGPHLSEIWPAGRLGSFTLNSNHEMYAGGRGYYLQALRHPTFAAQGGSGFFSLDCGAWRVLAIDTAYYDHGLAFMSGALAEDPAEAQNRFIVEESRTARDRGQKLLLLTHHHGLSLDGTTENSGLWNALLERLDGRLPDLWYWGHNHKGIVYRERTGAGPAAAPRPARLRCLGHASLPFGRAGGLFGPDGKLLDSIDYLTCTPLGGGHEHRVRNGWALLTLEGDGLHEEWIDQTGETAWTNTITH